MVYDWKHLDTVKQWKNLIFLNHQHLLNLSQHLLIFGHHFVIIPETLFTAIFSKENIRKNGQKKWKMSKLRKIFFPSIQKMWWHEYVWMKTCPPEGFWTPYHAHKSITRENPLHFRRLVKKWRFLTHFLPSTKIFACLVNKCWPNFCHGKKALTFLYKTLTLDFSYLS